jgi:hypothetical protein
MPLRHLISINQARAEGIKERQPDFFESLSCPHRSWLCEIADVTKRVDGA